MIRYDDTFYSQKPFSRDRDSADCIVTSRPKKISRIKKELRSKIAMCKMQLKHAGPHISEEMLARTKKDLAKYERQLESLSDHKCHKIKKTYKKMSPDKIRTYVLQQIEIAKSNNASYIVAEDIARHLNVKPHFVHQVFQKLNVEGILSQPIHKAPHDSNRDPWGCGGCSGWAADLYKIIYPDPPENET
jgi:hypothetical protein